MTLGVEEGEEGVYMEGLDFVTLGGGGGRESIEIRIKVGG